MGADQFDLWNELIIEKADALKPKNKLLIRIKVMGKHLQPIKVP